MLTDIATFGWFGDGHSLLSVSTFGWFTEGVAAADELGLFVGRIDMFGSMFD